MDRGGKGLGDMSHPNRLRDIDFKIAYGGSDDRLHQFYIPALSCSVQYDRTAGYFSSSALAVAAAGVARLIQNGGRMRLSVGAQLSQKDVKAIQKGHDLRDRLEKRLLGSLEEPVDALLRKRLEALAWMIAHGTLEIKVVLPLDEDGHPRPGSQYAEYFHIKTGVFTDAHSDQVAFSGSVNESKAAWLHNYEQFTVFTSWAGSQVQPYLSEAVGRFERLWTDREPDWKALDVPDAVRQRLLTYCPDAAPQKDPLEEPSPPPPKAPGRERVIFQYLRDAPHLVNAQGLGAATAGVRPWPHQTSISDQVVESFPRRYMLCDEVGLGKTIEAGLIIRQLILSGVVKRCLILAPRSICRQWQEELYETFVLDVPLYDGHHFWNVHKERLDWEGGNGWDACAIMIASSQLAKRRDRQEEVLEARPWDLVVVDEAHHARRKDFLQPIYRPNRLLELLSELKARGRMQGLLLMTATPMQVHPKEVWDLLCLLGLGGRWGASEDAFLRYFEELRKSYGQVDWDFVFAMVRDYLDNGGSIDPAFEGRMSQQHGPVLAQQVLSLPHSSHPGRRAKELKEKAEELVRLFAKEHTPVQRFMFRNTRELLREYVRKGLLEVRVPWRDPKLEWIAMRPEEEDLYNRIEEYISNFYRKYEAKRKGLGFVMTVYRRRLTSSFYAIRRSLERRLEFLRGESDTGLTDDEIEQEDLSFDVTEQLEAVDRSEFAGEIEYVEDFIGQLNAMGIVDSKVGQLKDDLAEIFKKRDRVLVFTLYTDTMDFLRDELKSVYGSQVACYSGRGGEFWNGIAWVETSKERVKNDFLTGERIKILVCTEAASEGLNLQTCGVLINYDMPWNPMRVEQRIGRIDRIGQVYERVWIRNYFYQGTVEARVYKALSKRIDWFEQVVGALQPILSQVGRTIEKLAMTPAQEREKELKEAISELEKDIESGQPESLDIDQWAIEEIALESPRSPVYLPDLEAILTQANALRERFQPHTEIERAYLLRMDGEQVAVTFDTDTFDANPVTLRLLSYGSEVLDSLMQEVKPPVEGESRGLLRLASGGPIPLCRYCIREGENWRAIESLGDLENALDGGALGAVWSEEAVSGAKAAFEEEHRELKERQAQIVAQRRRSTMRMLEERLRRKLVDATLVELARAQMPELFDRTEDFPLTPSSEAIKALSRHGYPYSAALSLVETEGLRPSLEDPYFQRIQSKSKAELDSEFAHLKGAINSLVHQVSEAREGEVEAKGAFVEPCVQFLL